jgi:hypothetical protein
LVFGGLPADTGPREALSVALKIGGTQPGEQTMTNYVIVNDSYDTSAIETTALTLNNGDNVLVTSSGSLIASGNGSDGLDVDGNNSVTILGTVYGTDQGIGSPQNQAANSFESIDVQGTVMGQFAGILLQSAYASDASVSVVVATNGVVNGDVAGIQLSGQTVALTVNGQVSASGNINYDFSDIGVNLYGASNTLLEGSTGSISGQYGIVVATDATLTTNMSLDGSVLGTQNGIIYYGDELDLNIGTTGTVAGGAGAGIALQGAGGATIWNEGTIEGATGILASTYVGNNPSDITLKNTGTIQDGINFAASSFDTITNTHGTISGAVTLGDYDTVTNSNGTIGDGLVFAYGDILTNSGTIDGGIQAAGAAIIENAGTITGGIADFAATADTIDNTGRILGMVDPQAAILTNSGTMHGELSFTTQSRLDNSGTITGAVVFNGSDDTVTNSGTIHGAVSLGTSDSFLNSGTIHGTLTLGSGDTLNMSTGSVTGVIAANTSDTFDFSGQFGHYQIAGFVPQIGHNTGYDIIDFASDEFTSYTELQAHMAQVGKDVVITLDATDDIVLIGAKLTQITTHDFLFT